MTTHNGRTFLNSCLKVPIDPCNNCPAPIYNRPKMYLGRLTTTTTTATTRTAMRTPASQRTKVNKVKSENIAKEAEAEPGQSASGDVRSLAKLYDSIPDYCDINHLPEAEFYSTLDSLRSSCRALKVNAHNGFSVLEQSSTTSSLSLHCGKAEKSKKHKNKSKAESKLKCYKSPAPCVAIELPKHVQDLCRLRSLNDVCAYEMKAFRKHLSDVETELEQRNSATQTNSVTDNKREYHEINGNSEKTATPTAPEDSATVPVKPTLTSTLRETLRKSFSFNDIHSLNDSPLPKTNNNKHTRGSVSQTNFSKYFMPKSTAVQTEPSPAEQQNQELPRINVESPSTGTVSSKLSSTPSGDGSYYRRKKKKPKKSNKDKTQPPFTLFDLSVKKENIEHMNASPVHPVARPNLAATLRAEVSKKKLKELQSNCTYHDSTPQFDWEVRKTPAWKSLSLNESHKAILQIRLATRKAEQALQQKEYELNMELMRQRVKSAPLLLEGQTFWGPIVGKLTHNCQREGIRHACETQQRKQRRRNMVSSRSGQSARRCQSKCNCNDMKNRFEVIQKIYAASDKSYSRNSTHLEMRSPRKQKKQSTARKSQAKSAGVPPTNAAANYNDSGDELSSYDRALL